MGSVEEIAKNFADLSFDDTKGKQHCRKLLIEIQSTYKHLPRDHDGALPKQSMIADMTKLVAIIETHLASEFIALPELFDDKFNHRYVLFWIIVRDYDGVTVFPTWYPGLSKLMSWTDDCRSVTKRMITYLKEIK